MAAAVRRAAGSADHTQPSAGALIWARHSSVCVGVQVDLLICWLTLQHMAQGAQARGSRQARGGRQKLRPSDPDLDVSFD